MTFAELFEWVEKNNIDWNSEIYYERIEDWYFDKSNWKPLLVSDNINKDIPDQFVKVQSTIKYQNINNKIFLTAHY